MLIDSHCHLNFPELSGDIDGYLAKMRENGVTHAVCIGTRPDNLASIVALATKHSNLFATVGIHPDEYLDGEIIDRELLIPYLSNPKVIGVGETGLDYHWNDPLQADLSWQHDRFRMHIEVAKEYNLPLVVHTRKSIDDTLAIMKETNAIQAGAVMHCFTENLAAAKKALDDGYYISMSGIVTFKNAHDVKEVAKYVPEDRLLVETDAPFLAPMPHRGALNHPAYVLHTAQHVADLRGVSLEHIANITSTNFMSLFAKTKRIIEMK